MKNQTNNFSAQALQLFFKFSGWVAGPIIIAVFVGKWLDNKYQTRPWIFLASVGLAFVFTSIAITRQALVSMKEMESSTKPSDQDKQNLS